MNRSFEYVKPATYIRRKTPFIDREFQVKYTLLLIGASALGMILITVPIFYFINQNYQIFLTLAYDHSPEILKHLEQERVWINTILFSVFSGLLIFFSIIGFKMTTRIVGPLKVLRNHLKQISRGHWHSPPIKVRESDEFQDLIEAYNYFYSSFQTNIKKDLERLKKIHVDSKNKDAELAWKSMVDEKAAQLNLIEQGADPKPIFLNDEVSAASPGSRHAS